MLAFGTIKLFPLKDKVFPLLVVAFGSSRADDAVVLPLVSIEVFLREIQRKPDENAAILSTG
jgi:hypothetical protein